MKLLLKYCLYFFLFLNFQIGFANPNVTGSQCPEYLQLSEYITHYIRTHDLSVSEQETLKTLVENFQPNQKVLSFMDHQAEKWPWWKYEKNIITPKRIRSGRLFLKKHEIILKQLALAYPIPAEYLVAIIGLETSYGQNKGNFNAFQTLSTLGFYYPRRAKFFKKELGYLLQLAHQEQFNLSTLKSSYAGALGYPQFMPSSYITYGNNYFKKPTLDLLQDPDTALASVANYLTKHGWDKKSFVMKVPEKTQNISQDSENKSKIKSQILVGFQTDENRPEHFDYYEVGKNFFTIRKYNLSDNYVFAVHLLAQKIAEKSD